MWVRLESAGWVKMIRAKVRETHVVDNAVGRADVEIFEFWLSRRLLDLRRRVGYLVEVVRQVCEEVEDSYKHDTQASEDGA